MDAQTVAFLEERMRASRVYLEYGSGGSTRLAVRLQVPHVFSVESDQAYGRAVRRVVQQELGATEFEMLLPDLGPTGAWGFPSNTERFRNWSSYPIRIWSLLKERQLSPDLVLVDGRFRVACLLASLLASRPGTALVFDDYAGRHNKYGVVQSFVPVSRMIGRAALFETPERFDDRGTALALARYAINPD